MAFRKTALIWESGESGLALFLLFSTSKGPFEKIKKMHWENIWIVTGYLFALISFLPFINASHWVFRIADFVRLQLLAILFVLLSLGLIFFSESSVFAIACNLILAASIVYHILVIWPYFPTSKKANLPNHQKIIALSVNVMQANTQYQRLIDLVQAVKPDLLLTMETDKTWEEHLSPLENYFKHVIRCPKDNRYGMHLYTNLPLQSHKIQYLISEEHPSIEATLKDTSNTTFKFWGIHPPPPSPTEKPTSLQKDAELMKLAKMTFNTHVPVVVMGDFNNVCWSRSSRHFSALSQLKDARIGRGFYGTFPAKYPFLRFPIDLMFHSPSVKVGTLKTAAHFGSDHIPLYAAFQVNSPSKTNNGAMPNGLKNYADETIAEGKEAAKEENGQG